MLGKSMVACAAFGALMMGVGSTQFDRESHLGAAVVNGGSSVHYKTSSNVWRPTAPKVAGQIDDRELSSRSHGYWI